MHNEIKSVGVKIPKDMELVQRRIDERLTHNGCRGKSFIFNGEKVTTQQSSNGEKVHFKKLTTNGVRISVALEGNQCVIGVLSSQRDKNFMEPETVSNFISLKTEKATPEKTKEDIQKIIPQEVMKESKKEPIPYSPQEAADETFIGLFFLFLKEFFEKRPSKVETSSNICEGFNLSSTCEDNRCMTTIRTAKLLIELARRNKVIIVQTKPHGLYSLAAQEAPISAVPVQTNESQSPKVMDILTTLLARKNELENTLKEHIEAIDRTRESINQVDVEIREIPNIMTLYETLRKTLG